MKENIGSILSRCRGWQALKKSWNASNYNKAFWVIVPLLSLTAFILGLILVLHSANGPWKSAKHALAIFAALLTLLASVLQALKARDKAREDESEAVHFHVVKKGWWVVAGSAAVAFIAEIIDLCVDWKDL